MYWNQGRRKAAEGLFVQVIEVSEKVLGEEHPNALSKVVQGCEES